MKRIITGIWILLTLVFACLLAGYISNEVMISRYNKGEYVSNRLSFAAFTQQYIKHFNQGNLYYKNGAYEAAIDEYDKALNENPPKERECLIRINKALAMVMPIDPAEVNKDNLDETIKLLDAALLVLTEKGCAVAGDETGHNADAEQLYNDIEKFKEELKNQSEEEENQDEKEDSEDEKEDSGNENEEPTTESSVDDAEEKQDELQQLQEQAADEREDALEDYDYLYNYDIYYGDTW